ncbi:putative ABC transport system permease protein [Pricia antarctica]|uniref:Putative ABC transport system permease protein n=1 Tax=Pricia antarctica TaxID=641691 RepID=A0A1G7DIR1_9FLAO|nr:ABC transporter permease [Pricia antarctica]SDE51389.1 putative ABC transport system permease protein [Pricia antarctica]
MLKNNLKIAWRNIKRHIGYSLLNIGGMAIGLAAFWLIALYVADELSYERSFSNAERIYRIAQHANWEDGNFDMAVTSPPYASTLKRDFPEVEDAVRIGIEAGDVMHYENNTIKQDDICFAENSFFRLFDHPFLYGDANTALVEPGSIVITESLALKLFADPSRAINETIGFGSGKYPVKVTGVIPDMPPNSHLQFSGIRSFKKDDLKSENWDDIFLYTYILLKKGTAIKSLENKLLPLEKDIAQQMGVTDFQMELQPLTDIHLNSDLDYELSSNGSLSRVYMFIVIGLLVLLIAVINYMNLSTARSTMRVKEIGIRKVVGSGKTHLIGLFISEALLVTFIAAVVAYILVQLTLPFFNELAEKELGLWRFGIVNTIGAILVFTALTGVLSGSYPALFLSRFKMIPSLKGQLGNMRSSVVLRKSLVVVQFVITVCLISGSYIIYRQMQYVSQKDLGFDKEQILISHIDNMKLRSEIEAFKEALLKSPFVESAATAGNPMGTGYIGKVGFNFEVNGQVQETPQVANFLYMDEDFLPTNGMELIQGRNFSKDMPTDKDGAVIINQTQMEALGYSDAIGKKVQYKTGNDSTVYRQVIGVAKDFHSTSLLHKIEPMVMLMPPEDGERDNLYVKIAKSQAAAGIAFVKNTFDKFDPDNQADVHFLDDNFNRQYLAVQKQEKLSLIFTILAFLISCFGLLGLVLFIAAQRKKEIGVRKVLGASISSVTVMLSKDFGKLVAIAALIAFPIGWFIMDRWLQDFAYRIELKWWMFLLSGGIAVAIALLTVSFQAINAAMANPVKSLRTE